MRDRQAPWVGPQAVSYLIGGRRRHHDADLTDASLSHPIHDVVNDWPIGHRNELLGQGMRQWSKTSPLPTREHQCLHHKRSSFPCSAPLNTLVHGAPNFIATPWYLPVRLNRWL